MAMCAKFMAMWCAMCAKFMAHTTFKLITSSSCVESDGDQLPRHYNSYQALENWDMQVPLA